MDGLVALKNFQSVKIKVDILSTTSHYFDKALKSQEFTWRGTQAHDNVYKLKFSIIKLLYIQVFPVTHWTDFSF